MTAQPQIDISVQSDRWDGLDFDARKRAEEVLPIAWNKTKLPPVLKRYKDVEISLVLSDDAHVQTLNRDFRKIDKPTNVLSFANLDAKAGAPKIDGPLFPLGDIVVAFETTAREAGIMEVPFQTHYTHLLVHGLLHLLGFDHMNEEDANVMESLEIQILASMGIENPYSRSRFVA